MRYDNQVFTNTLVELDDHQFVGCHFEACELVYAGGPPPFFYGCTFVNSSWTFTGAAENVLRFLDTLYHTAGEGGRKLIEDTFENIRRGWLQDLLH